MDAQLEKVEAGMTRFKPDQTTSAAKAKAATKAVTKVTISLDLGRGNAPIHGAGQQRGKSNQV